MIFHEIQEKRNEDKVSQPWLLIIFVGRIVRQDIIDISEDYLTNKTGV